MSGGISWTDHRLGNCSQDTRKDPLSLLTLVDMAIALENQKPSEKDHTYAVAQKSTRGKISPNIGNDLLVQKEKDHNYSFHSKSVSLRHKPNANVRHSQPEPTRSSSEENLSFHISSSCNHNNSNLRTAMDDTSLTTSKKRNPFGKNRSYLQVRDDHTPLDHTYPCSFDSQICSNADSVSDAMQIRNVRSEPMAMDDSYLGSHSWPKENMFPPFRGRDGYLSNTLPANYRYKYDHTYAQGEVKTDESMCISESDECHKPGNVQNTSNRMAHKSTVLKTDHNYNKGTPCDTKTKLSGSPSHIQAPKLKLKNNRIDHNYSGFTGTFSSVPSQPLGSVESLDMEFSHSDTDSCEETEVEEQRLAITSTISAWLQLRKDHPYSSI